MNKGTEFEKTVALIENALKGTEATVSHNVKMMTNYGIERQIDVLVEHKCGRLTFKTIIECKNTTAKVPVSTVDAFNSVVDDVGADKGIIVSAAGFQSGAIESAKNSRVKLYELSDANNLADYLLTQVFFYYKLNHRSVETIVSFSEPKEVNNEVTLYTKLFCPFLNNSFSIEQITQQYLHKSKETIATTLIERLAEDKTPQIVKATTNVEIKFTKPVIYANASQFTHVLGYKMSIQTDMLSGPSKTLNVSEYKDAIQQKSYALVYEVEFDGQTHKLVQEIKPS